MRLEDGTRLGGSSAADFAVACERGTGQVRSLVSPLLPVLYTFVARRAQDAEEAEDLLVETLLLARAEAGSGVAGRMRLLPWLLRLADRGVRARIGVSPVLEAGMEPGRVVFDAPATPELLEAIGRLPADKRQILGMRFGDGLSEELIGEVLGTDSRTAASLVEKAVEALAISWWQRERAFKVEPEARGVRAALSPFLATAALTPAQEERVWRRYDEEEQGEFSPARPLPKLPRWARRVLAGLALLALLAALGLWLRGGPEERGVDTAAANALVSFPPVNPTVVMPTPIAEAATPRVEVSSPSYGAARSAPRWRHQGRVYYVQRVPDVGPTLMVLDGTEFSALGEPLATGLAGPFDRQDSLVYAVSPSRSSVLFGVRGGISLKRGEETQRYLLPVNAESAGRRDNLVEALAWHPAARRFAFVVYSSDPRKAPTRRLRVAKLDPDGRGGEGVTAVADVARLNGSVSGLSYSRSGRYLLATLEPRGVLVIDTENGHKVLRLPGGVGWAQWSPASDRLLWRSAPAMSTDGAFGIVRPDGRDLRALGKASLAVWHPDGKHLILGTSIANRKPSGGLAFWLYDPDSGERRKLSDVPGMDTSGEVSVGPDGGHLVYAVEDSLYLVHFFRSGRVEKLLTSPGWVSSVRWYDDPRPVSLSTARVTRRGAAASQSRTR
jgi:DNA-directed RNA polymerase specialized sigma24 family protein